MVMRSYLKIFESNNVKLQTDTMVCRSDIMMCRSDIRQYKLSTTIPKTRVIVHR